ncbi:MAG TPA: HNH endonuclease signature motif containing protein, partial [Polyangiaceae bacterium]|nr:HNH endonuclease signature motif containing protein [Polyangiaceae bacterium]
MPSLPEFETIPDDELLASVRMLVARTNTALASLLAHLAEVEARGIHRQRACASLYTYCIYELRMSEDEAYRRAKAARLVRQYPELFERIATGELHLSGLLLLGPQLDCERRREILDCARFRSKREIQELVARLNPKPEVPSLVEPIGPAPAGAATHVRLVAALAGPVRSLPVGERPADWIEEAGDVAFGERWQSDRIDDEGPGSDTAFAAVPDESDQEAAKQSPWLSPMRFKVQFTASQEYVDSMNEALDLLSHEMSDRDIAELHARAMQALVVELRKQKRAETDSPRPSSPRRRVTNGATPSRHISAVVRRQVWTRDEARCRYVADDGRRCSETARLEIHHRVAYAKGGSHDAENLELRIMPHSVLCRIRRGSVRIAGQLRGTTTPVRRP